MTEQEAQAKVHEAIGGLLDEGEIAIAWTLTIDVAAHRAGGGIDGNSSPMMWTALGMLRASVGVAERQLAACTGDHEDDDE